MKRRILFVCLGNICRSTMAEMVMKHLVRARGLENEFYIDSAGTSNEEAGNPVYPNTRAVLKQKNIHCDEHFARQMVKADYANFDYIICMEQSNVRAVMRIIGADIYNKVYRLLDFTGNPGDIGDPWYHRDFDKTYEEVLQGCEALLNKIMID